MLPKAVCCYLQTCNVYIMKLAMGYIHIPSYIILGSWIYRLHHINGLYHNVWPGENSCHFLLFTSKQNSLKKINMLLHNCHGFQSSCKVSPLYLVWFLRYASRNWTTTTTRILKTDFLEYIKNRSCYFHHFLYTCVFEHTNWAIVSKVGSDS